MLEVKFTPALTESEIRCQKLRPRCDNCDFLKGIHCSLLRPCTGINPWMRPRCPAGRWWDSEAQQPVGIDPA